MNLSRNCFLAVNWQKHGCWVVIYANTRPFGWSRKLQHICPPFSFAHSQTLHIKAVLREASSLAEPYELRLILFEHYFTRSKPALVWEWFMRAFRVESLAFSEIKMFPLGAHVFLLSFAAERLLEKESFGMQMLATGLALPVAVKKAISTAYCPTR